VHNGLELTPERILDIEAATNLPLPYGARDVVCQCWDLDDGDDNSSVSDMCSVDLHYEALPVMANSPYKDSSFIPESAQCFSLDDADDSLSTASPSTFDEYDALDDAFWVEAGRLGNDTDRAELERNCLRLCLMGVPSMLVLNQAFSISGSTSVFPLSARGTCAQEQQHLQCLIKVGEIVRLAHGVS
jgi:hypothetical protein